MIRATVILLVCAALAAGAAWLVHQSGAVSLTWQGYRVDTSVAVLLAAVALISVLVATLHQLWRLLRRAPGAFVRQRRESRRLKGYRALTQGMVAVAAGDADEAQRQARRADLLLNEPPLTLLLSAQAAQLKGDEAAAARYFTAMLERPETEFLGLRGLIMQAKRRGATARALDLARRALALRPRTAWVLGTLHELQVSAGAWDATEQTVRRALRAKAMGAAEARRGRAIACYQQSLAAETAGTADRALAAARKAVALAPGFVPAALRAAGLLAKAGKRRRAARLAEAAWEASPHPALARLYGALGADDTPLGRLMRIQRLAARAPDALESRLALAEAALEARLWGEARRALQPLGASDGVGLPARACRLWAALEEAEHGDAAKARAWLGRAAAAAPDPAWLCADCGTAHADWAPLCAHCGAYDSMAWRSPLQAASPAAPLAPAAAAVSAPLEAASPPAPAALAAVDQGPRPA